MDEKPSSKDVRAHWAVKSEPWTRWADTVAPMAARFNEHLIEAAGIALGHSILDIASGAGEPVLSLPDIVGREGKVVATDIVPSMLSGLRSRTGAERLLLAAADVQALPFRTDGFDRVTCRFGLMFVPDPARGLAEVARILRPGGRAAFMVWGPREDQTLFPLFSEAIRQVTGQEPDPHHYQMFRFGQDQSLTPLFAAAGLREIAEFSVRFTPTAPLDKPFWRPQLEMSFGHVLDGAPESVRDEIDNAIRALLAPSRTTKGYPMKAHIRIATGIS